jgi:hypothetical protein
MTSPSNSAVQNLLPVQAYFNLDGSFSTFIGQGEPFYATANPSQSGLNITNSTINSTTIGATSPSTGVFTNIATTTGTITTAASGPTDIVNKQYVDYFAAGLSWKAPALTATSANITLSGLQTINGVTLVAGDVVLVKNQTNAAENGIYVASATAWTYSVGGDTWSEYVGAIIFVTSGSLNGTAWYCTAQPGGTLGVTDMNWSNFSVASTYTAGTGLTLIGTQFSITNTGVSAATYGSATASAVIVVNAQGQITSASSSTITPAVGSITGLGTGVATALAAGVTGSGNIVLATSPSLVTPLLGTVTSGDFSSGTFTWPTFNQSTTGNAATATNLAGGTAGVLPYQSAANTTTFLSVGTNGQILTLAGGVPTWANAPASGVTSVATAGTVNGITLTGGPITSTGTITLGGTLDLSSPPAIGGTTRNTAAFTTELVGPSASANFTRFPGALGVFSNIAAGIQQNESGNIGVIGEGLAGTGTSNIWGVGVYGVAYTSNTTGASARVAGVAGEAHVSASTDTMAATGVRGYSQDTHTGGINIGLYGTASGSSINNYSLYLNAGDIWTGAAATWTLNGNLTFSGASSVIIPTLNLTNALGVAYGGTGVATLSGLAYGNGTSAFTAATAAQIVSAISTTAVTNATNATNIGITDDTTTNTTMYPTWVTTTTGNLPAKTSSTKFTFNPSTGTLSATVFSGAGTSLTGTASSLSIGGNAATATTATTATTANATNTSNNFQMNSLGVGTAGSGTAGEIRATNNITAYYSSDRKFKENIRQIDNALQKVDAIGGKYFDWTDAYIDSKGGADGYFVRKNDIGVIAQDVQFVLPEAVRTREDGSLAVDYQKLVSLAFAAISELKNEIKELKSK